MDTSLFHTVQESRLTNRSMLHIMKEYNLIEKHQVPLIWSWHSEVESWPWTSFNRPELTPHRYMICTCDCIYSFNVPVMMGAKSTWNMQSNFTVNNKDDCLKLHHIGYLINRSKNQVPHYVAVKSYGQTPSENCIPVYKKCIARACCVPVMGAHQQEFGRISHLENLLSIPASLVEIQKISSQHQSGAQHWLGNKLNRICTFWPSWFHTHELI